MSSISERFINYRKKQNESEIDSPLNYRNFYYSNSPSHHKKSQDKNSDLLNIMD